MNDERRLRVTFEYVSPHTNAWVQASNEGDEQGDGIIDQYNQLKEWEQYGPEPIRNVVLEELSVTARVISE